MSVWLTPGARAVLRRHVLSAARRRARRARAASSRCSAELAETYLRAIERVDSEADARRGRSSRQELGGRRPSGDGGGRPSAAAAQQPLDRRSRRASSSAPSTTVDGGLRRAPKFPSNLPIRLLLRYHRRTGDADAAAHGQRSRLEKMAAGGMARSARRRISPLLDRRALAGPALREDALRQRAARRRLRRGVPGHRREPTSRASPRETLDYVLRGDDRRPTGGFYSATDADSRGRGGEVLRLVRGEIRAVARRGPAPDRFIRVLRRHRRGGQLRRGDRTSCNRRRKPDEAEHAALRACANALRGARRAGSRPLRDEKILAGWNGLTISGAGGRRPRARRSPRYIDAPRARGAADFCLGKACARAGASSRSFEDGRRQAPRLPRGPRVFAAGLALISTRRRSIRAGCARRWRARRRSSCSAIRLCGGLATATGREARGRCSRGQRKPTDWRHPLGDVGCAIL